MNELRSLAANRPCGNNDEPQLRQPFRRRRVQRHAQLTRPARELASVRTDQRRLDTEAPQSGAKLDTLVVRAPASKQ
jgi:hypothetical protein